MGTLLVLLGFGILIGSSVMRSERERFIVQGIGIAVALFGFLLLGYL